MKNKRKQSPCSIFPIGKRGQEAGVGMSFGFLFSIILIIIFVFGAVWGVRYFLSLNACSNIGLSIDSLQKEVQTAYQSSSYSREIQLNFPGADKLCFANLSAPLTGDLKVYEEINIYEFDNVNTFLVPGGKSCGLSPTNIKFLNVSAITRMKNPYCVDANGKVQIVYEPSQYGRGVVIK
ncbi:Uncharacterised protein [uncultured archaeon]|nr:Uncharacterised protein [uncultured archaeon]